jgi:hypothetical protein
MKRMITVLSVSGGAGSYAEGGGQACQRNPRDPDLPGVRQASYLHADRDEDRQGIRRALRGVGGGGVASRRIPTLAPISRSPGATLCANFAQTEFSEVAFPSAPAGAGALTPLPYAS